MDLDESTEEPEDAAPPQTPEEVDAAVAKEYRSMLLAPPGERHVQDARLLEWVHGVTPASPGTATCVAWAKAWHVRLRAAQPLGRAVEGPQGVRTRR